MSVDKDQTPHERSCEPAVEGEPHAIEDVGVSSEAKIDTLLNTAVNVRQELQVHTRRVVVGLAVAATLFSIVFGLAFGVLLGLRSQAGDIRQITSDNLANGDLIRENSLAIRASTGPEAQARSAATVGAAISEIGRVGICAAFYVVNEYPPACQDVVAKMNSIRNGENPFPPR